MDEKKMRCLGSFLRQVAVDAVLVSRDECRESGPRSKQPATLHFVKNSSAKPVIGVYIECLQLIWKGEQIVVFLLKMTTKTATRPRRWVDLPAPIPSLNCDYWN